MPWHAYKFIIHESGTQERLKSEIQVELEKTSWNSRKLFASVHIKAPVGTVWSCLTDYEGLGEFIPSLVENQCLERRPNGALVRQVWETVDTSCA
jgi:uncharacterized protein YndB with AHSA1/START domain